MKKLGLNLLLVCFVVLFVGSGWYLLRYYRQAYETRKETDELSQMKEEAEITEKEREESETTGIQEKYLRLYKKNTDMVAWIQIEGTRVNYPVMKKEGDSEYYLHRNFKKEKDNNGLPFLAHECNIRDGNTNYLVYGHHMKSGMMFSDLLKYAKSSFYQSHREISFDTIYESGTYRVFCAFYTDVKNDKEHFSFYDYAGVLDESRFDSYMQEVAKRSIYPVEELPKYGQTLLTLVTCSYHTEDGRFVVVAAR